MCGGAVKSLSWGQKSHYRTHSDSLGVTVEGLGSLGFRVLGFGF